MLLETQLGLAAERTSVFLPVCCVAMVHFPHGGFVSKAKTEEQHSPDRVALRTEYTPC